MIEYLITIVFIENILVSSRKIYKQNRRVRFGKYHTPVLIA